MNKKLNEIEIQEFESSFHFIKYLLLKPDVQTHELWKGMLLLDDIGKKIMKENISSEDTNAIFDLDELKEFVCLFHDKLTKELEKEMD